MSNVTVPQYRVRLFLSVDLVGSTAHKSAQSNLTWFKAFQRFYGEFPSHLRRNYEDLCNNTPEIDDFEKRSPPQIWKTIGDEILFVNRVNSITHLSTCVRSFTQTLIDFGQEVQTTFDLNTKGNAWIAAFPTPNRSIKLTLNGSDPLIGNDEILTESVEAEVDKKPSDYDFLGKGIDGGFRIARNSSTDNFTISPALAYLLCKAKRNVDTTCYDGEFRFHEPQEFKGILKGQRYPVVSVITSRNNQSATIEEYEASLLGRPNTANFVDLQSYLEAYIEFHGIERPELKLTARGAEVDAPEYYKSYIVNWKTKLEGLTKTQSLEASSAEAGDLPKEQETQNPIDQTLLSKTLESLKIIIEKPTPTDN